MTKIKRTRARVQARIGTDSSALADVLSRRSAEAVKRPVNARFDVFASEDGTEAEIDVYDVIGGWQLNAATFKAQLNAITAKRITLNISSPGGSVFDAFAMYADLREHPAHVDVQVKGLAASAASLLAMAGDTITIADNGFLMIHNAWVIALGDHREMAKAAKLLAKIDKRLAATYADAARQRGEANDADHFAALMAEETWLDAEDAVSAGLADSIGEAAPVDAFAGLDISNFAKAPRVLVSASRTTKAPPKPAAPAVDLAPVSAAIRRCIETLTR